MLLTAAPPTKDTLKHNLLATQQCFRLLQHPPMHVPSRTRTCGKHMHTRYDTTTWGGAPGCEWSLWSVPSSAHAEHARFAGGWQWGRWDYTLVAPSLREPRAKTKALGSSATPSGHVNRQASKQRGMFLVQRLLLLCARAAWCPQALPVHHVRE